MFIRVRRKRSRPVRDEEFERQVDAILAGTHDNAFGFLGPQRDAAGMVQIRTFQPRAERVWVIDTESDLVTAELPRLRPEGFFAGPAGQPDRFRYRLRCETAGQIVDVEDPYRFAPILASWTFTCGRKADICVLTRNSARIRVRSMVSPA